MRTFVMFEYALQFYNNYMILFYLFLILAAIFEWPVTILAFSLFAVKLNVGFFEVLIFTFIGEFFGDILHYMVWRYFRIGNFRNKKLSILKKIKNKLDWYSLLSLLVVIKYTPPITSIGLLYLWRQKTNFFKFIKNISIFAIFNWLIITTIGYNFGYLFKDKWDFMYLIIALFLSFILFYFIVKVIIKNVVKKIYKKNNKYG